MRLGKILRRYRIVEEITTRDLGRQIGISASTVCRIEAGESVNSETIAALMIWLFSKDDSPTPIV